MMLKYSKSNAKKKISGVLNLFVIVNIFGLFCGPLLLDQLVPPEMKGPDCSCNPGLVFFFIATNHLARDVLLHQPMNSGLQIALQRLDI